MMYIVRLADTKAFPGDAYDDGRSASFNTALGSELCWSSCLLFSVGLRLCLLEAGRRVLVHVKN